MTQIGLLEYTVQPPAVFAGQTVDLSLVVSNPLSGSAVVFQGGRQDADQLQITFTTTGDDALTDDLNFTAAVTAQPALPDPPGAAVPFSVLLNGPSFVLKPQGASSSSTSTLEPGQSLTVTFRDVAIDAAAGVGTIGVKQLIGFDTPPSGTLSVQKKPMEPGLVTWLDPPLIAGGATSTLRWTAVGGSSLQVVGFPYGPGTKTFPLSGTPPVSGSTTASIQAGTHAQTYTVSVIKPGTGPVATNQVTLQFHVPFISLFASSVPLPPELPADRTVTLEYATVFTATASLIDPISAKPLRNPVSGSVVVDPGADAYTIGGDSSNIPGSLNYTLEASGYSTPALETICVRLAPIQVLYFKYTQNDDGTLSAPRAATLPSSWPGVRIEPAPHDVLVLTVWGPGGQIETRYLGSGDTTHPQIQWFDAQEADGDELALTWVTANLTDLVLDPGGRTIPPDQIDRGGTTIDPGSADALVLTGTGPGGTVTSTILLGSSGGAARIAEGCRA